MPARAVSPDLHVLVRKALRALKPHARSEWSANDMDDGLLRTPRGFLGLAVAPGDVERAGRILDTVIRLVEGEALGGRVVIEPKKSIIEVGGDRFRFRLKQETTRSDHKPTPAERRAMAEDEYFHKVPKWEWRVTDRLALEIYDPEFSYRPRATLSDGKRGRLEQKIPTLADTIRKLIGENREREAERDRINAAWAEQRRLEKEAEERANRDRKAREDLISEAARWRRAKDVSDYINAVEAALRQRCVPEGAPEWARVRWGRAVVRELDPITGAGPLGPQASR